MACCFLAPQNQTQSQSQNLLIIRKMINMLGVCAHRHQTAILLYIMGWMLTFSDVHNDIGSGDIFVVIIDRCEWGSCDGCQLIVTEAQQPPLDNS